jgi:PAS domain S-box-containing protein
MKIRKAAASVNQAADRELQRTNRLLSTQLRAMRVNQRTLERARAHYSDLFDFAPVTYTLLDGVGMILKVNLAACRLLRVERSRLIGHPLLPFVLQQDRRELLEHLRRCRSGSGVIESEIRFRTPRGSVTCRLFSKKAVYEDRDAFPTVLVDQTDHLRLDEARLHAERQRGLAERASLEAQAANRSKDRFLAVVSHELRTPLTPALFAASRLASWEELPEQARALADTIKRNIELEARLIDDLLDVARISRNRLALQFARVDVHDVLREVIRVCQSVADAKGVALLSHLAADERHVRGDEARLRQAFWNILSNALKFTDTGGTVIIRSSNPEDHHVRVTVRDNGVGMDAESLERLFEPFDRRPSDRDSRLGLGLGLTLSKGIVAAHRGQLSATSEGPGRGSTFFIDLQSVPAAGEHIPLPSEISGPAGDPHDNPHSRPLRILIVEDDTDSREILEMFLTHHGCEVEIASSLTAGLDRLDDKWDVVLSDLGLPDGSGLEMARYARNLSEPPRKLIAFTGYGASADIQASRDAGFDDHIVKPVDLDRLLGLLRNTTPTGAEGR